MTGDLRHLSNLLDAWDQLVESIEDSYHDNIHEYEYDLRIREALETLAARPDMPEWTREKLSEVDQRLRAVLRPERVDDDPKVPWWLAYIPRYAGKVLAADFVTCYGVEVEIRQ